jgi:hypothetical protein
MNHQLYESCFRNNLKKAIAVDSFEIILGGLVIREFKKVNVGVQEDKGRGVYLREIVEVGVKPA